MKYKNIREAELKNKIAVEYFKQFDTTAIIGDIDFTVLPKQDGQFGKTPLLWAESKTGDFDIPAMFVQLILTIGKARTFDKSMPPVYIGAFDFKKFTFIEYLEIQDIFYLNDFNWNVAPSNHSTKEFKLIKQRIEFILNEKMFVFDYQNDENELKLFIKNNIGNATTKAKIQIDKNNFIPIYLRWLQIIKPIIDVKWDELRKINIIDGDFFLADLFVEDNDTQNIDDDTTVKDKLFVIFQNQGYRIAKEDTKQMFDSIINLRNKDTYTHFCKIYKRPPIKEFRDYIIERRDLLVPQDIRERKGAFFTPRIWVELSQKYITNYLGENWQDEYYIWDCASGTGNLLAGLTNKYNTYASTIDQGDINVINERIENGANLLKNHVFQFDFLNDDFSKLPQSLQDIINDTEKRKKLIIFINPPYAEATTAKTVFGTGENKAGVTTSFRIKEQLNPKIGNATNEFFALFMAVIYEKIPDCLLCQFSTLKFVNGSNFRKFKLFFQAKYIGGFVVPADTFDNVNGKFPIGFTLWNTADKVKINEVSTDVYDKNGNYSGVKTFYGNLPKSINNWIKSFHDSKNMEVGLMVSCAPDFQHNNQLAILSKQQKRYCFVITERNIIPMSIYFAVRHCISSTWINDRDQFLWPKDDWQTDTEFQNDCLVFTLFNSANNITSSDKINHWLPFTEQEVQAQEKFASNWMTNFINGKIKYEQTTDLFGNESNDSIKREFSNEALAVFDSGRELWKYYHNQPQVNVNASLYDIRAYFQGRNQNGRMNSKSDDSNYMDLILQLRSKLDSLADKITPKVYEHGFLLV